MARDQEGSMKRYLRQDGIRGLLLASGLVIVLGIGQLWLWPFVHQSAFDLQDEWTREGQLQEMQKRIGEITQAYDEQRANLDQLRAAFPYQNETAQVVERLEQLAAQTGVDLDITGIQETPAEDLTSSDSIVPITVRLQVTGLAPALLRYLDAIEQVQELTQVQAWSLAPFRRADQPTVTPAVGLYGLAVEIIFYLQATPTPNG